MVRKGSRRNVEDAHLHSAALLLPQIQSKCGHVWKPTSDTVQNYLGTRTENAIAVEAMMNILTLKLSCQFLLSTEI